MSSTKTIPADLKAGEPENVPLSATTELIDSHQLLGKNGEVKIVHNGEIYSLRKTRNGKLILTK
jgi:hemin uptake protein HemP